MNNQENDKSEALVGPSDQMLSSLLKDFLCDVSPPDLKSKVITKLASIGTESDSRSQVEFDQAVQSASKDFTNGYGVVIPPPVSVVHSGDPELSIWIRRGVIVAAALAASVVGVIFLPDAMKSWNDNSDRIDIAKEPTELMPDENAPIVARDKTLKIVDEGVPRSAFPEVVPAESIATNADKRMSQIPSLSNPRMPQTSVESNAMNDSDVVRVIDDQLSYFWQRVGVTPAAEVRLDTWLDRTAVVVLGRQATSAEKEAFRSNKSENKIANYVDSLVSNDEFARNWSTQLAEHYLGKRLRATRDLASLERAFVEWLEESVSEKAFVGDMESHMIAGRSKRADGPMVLKDAAAFWLAETMERSASVQRELVGSGSLLIKREPREESLIGVSRQLMRLSGNPSMVCSQCHTEETGISDLRGYLAMSKGKGAGGSSSFWSVPASLSGLNLVFKDSERYVQLDSSKDFFYEDGEGRMKLAKAGPPSLSKTLIENESLAAWFRGSIEPRRALVDMVWNQVFQQPLVPTIGLSEGEGLSERVDLRDLLASQMQLRKADLGTLVRWVVLSKPLRLEGLKTDAPWYLKSTLSQIAASQKQMRIFAGYPRGESVQVESGRLPVGKVPSWIEQQRSFQKSDAMLAQGTNLTSSNKVEKPLKLDYSEAQVRYLISVEEPYSQIHAIADRLAKSSMSWPMLVEHAYLATDARFPTRGERDEASKLLETSGKDRMKTLVMVVNARLGSW